MRKITLVILTVLIASCAVAKNKKPKKKAKQPANEITSVLMRRTGCFGHCPTYTIDINKDGMAIYNAERFNTDSGVFRKKIGVAKAAEILNEVNKYRPDTCREMYENMIPDLPNLNYEIVYKNKTKKIYSAIYGPDFLSILARKIEAVGLKNEQNNTGWERVTDGTAK